MAGRGLAPPGTKKSSTAPGDRASRLSGTHAISHWPDVRAFVYPVDLRTRRVALAFEQMILCNEAAGILGCRLAACSYVIELRASQLPLPSSPVYQEIAQTARSLSRPGDSALASCPEISPLGKCFSIRQPGLSVQEAASGGHLARAW